MKKLLYIFLAATLLFSCTRLEQEVPAVAPEEEEVQGKVLVKFNVTLPELTFGHSER